MHYLSRQEWSHATTTMTDFLVVKAHPLYNVFVDYPTLRKMRAITSTYYLKMKFLIDVTIGEVHGEQVLAREYYMQKLKNEGMDVKTIDEREVEEAITPHVQKTYQMEYESMWVICYLRANRRTTM